MCGVAGTCGVICVLGDSKAEFCIAEQSDIRSKLGKLKNLLSQWTSYFQVHIASYCKNGSKKIKYL